MHHVSTDHQDVLQVSVGGNQAGCLCQGSWEGGASASNIPCSSIDAAKFELGHNRGRRSDVIRAVGAHDHQVDILGGQTGVCNRSFSGRSSKIRSSPIIWGIKASFDAAVILKLENNLCQFGADLTHPLSKGFICNFVFGQVHPGS